jgi:hypothetical protein
MKKFIFMAGKALFYVRSRPAWWGLAFLQVLSIFLQASSWKMAAENRGFLFLWLIWFFALMLISMVLWMKIRLVEEKQADVLKPNVPDYFLVGAVALVSVRILIYLIEVWTIRSLLTSLVSVSFLAAALASVLLGSDFGRAIKISLDLWVKRGLVMSIGTFLLLFCHALFFGLGRMMNADAVITGGFSDFKLSATIWSLLILLLVPVSFIVAWINATIVLGFLDIINTVKPKKPSLSPAAAVAAPEAAN